MARKTGGGSLLILLIGIGWVMSKCGGGSTHTPAPALVSSPPEVATLPAEPTETMYVNAAVLNQRSAPNGTVVSKVAGGDSVTIYERRDNWVRISASDLSPLWVSGSHLCSGSGCYTPKQSHSRSTTPTRRSRSNYIDNSCPCSGNRVCIGPRGGRFCITSGGNKRYGV
jgi:hypothetical protein